MEARGALHFGWGKVKIAVAWWVLRNEVLLVSKEVVARIIFCGLVGVKGWGRWPSVKRSNGGRLLLLNQRKMEHRGGLVRLVAKRGVEGEGAGVSDTWEGAQGDCSMRRLVRAAEQAR
jgi:hypothetical protein